jgi:hypothetical protein
MSKPTYEDPEVYADLVGFRSEWRDLFWRDDFLDMIVARVAPVPGAAVLEIGCGAVHPDGDLFAGVFCRSSGTAETTNISMEVRAGSSFMLPANPVAPTRRLRAKRSVGRGVSHNVAGASPVGRRSAAPVLAVFVALAVDMIGTRRLAAAVGSLAAGRRRGLTDAHFARLGLAWIAAGLDLRGARWAVFGLVEAAVAPFTQIDEYGIVIPECELAAAEAVAAVGGERLAVRDAMGRKFRCDHTVRRIGTVLAAHEATRIFRIAAKVPLAQVVAHARVPIEGAIQLAVEVISRKVRRER